MRNAVSPQGDGPGGDAEIGLGWEGLLVRLGKVLGGDSGAGEEEERGLGHAGWRDSDDSDAAGRPGPEHWLAGGGHVAVGGHVALDGDDDETAGEVLKETRVHARVKHGGWDRLRAAWGPLEGGTHPPKLGTAWAAT